MRLSALILFPIAAILFALDVSILIPIFFAWLGAIQLLNGLSHRLPFRRGVHWAYAMSYEGLAIFSVALLRFIPMRKKTSGKRRPILLVHGYVNHGSVWRIQKRRLEAKGFGPIYVINLGHPFRSIRSYAEKLKVKVASIAKETGRTDLILVGHSMGGLVSSWYATQMAPPNTVTDIITIASPFNGTLAAHIGLGSNAREMRPRSSLLKELGEAIQKNNEIRFHHIASKADQLVIPGSAILPQNKHFIYDDIGHASLLYSQRVTEKLDEWLSKMEKT